MAEYWDLYDRDRNPLGRLHRRGDPIPAGAFHLVVMVWLRGDDGRYIIDQRHPDKPFGLMWECTGGSVVAGGGQPLRGSARAGGGDGDRPAPGGV